MTDQSKTREVLLKELKVVYSDFKFSVVTGEITSNGISADHIFFKNLGIFRRFVSKEIENIVWDEDVESGRYQLIFELNREGLYDMLPEGVSHADRKKKFEDHIETFREQRQKEKEARKFFNPIENEFERRLLQFDIIERELINNSNAIRSRDFFEHFFGDSKMLDYRQLLALTFLLPLSHKVRTNTELISLVLSKILNFKIIVSKEFKSNQILFIDGTVSKLGSQHLGIDSILSDSCLSSSFYYNIVVYDVPAPEYQHFAENGKHWNVINFILPFYFPVNGKVGMSLHPIEEEKNLWVFEAGDKHFLDFNSYI